MKRHHQHVVLTPTDFGDIEDTTISTIETHKITYAYVQGGYEPNYPVPAIAKCLWCGSTDNICNFNDDGYWCPEFCFEFNTPLAVEQR